SEHRVINVERQHADAMHGVTGRRRPRADRTCLADPLFEDLPVHCLAIGQERADVFRLVPLTGAGVDCRTGETDWPFQTSAPRLPRSARRDVAAPRLSAGPTSAERPPWSSTCSCLPPA